MERAASRAAYREAHREELCAKQRDYYQKNKDTQRAWHLKNYAENREKLRAKAQAYYLKNREKIRTRSLLWGKENREEKNRKQRERYPGVRERRLQTDFNLSTPEYEELLQEQHGVCAVCSTPPDGVRQRYLCVDHDHYSGRVRGLLCHSCNLILGHADDDPARLRAAAAYLEISGGVK